ncbi:MGT family glycosyltransferase-like protein, partial [Dinothrombium tinctorium]
DYELAENMYGAQTLPQLAVLPLVDLVITHGGNNTVIESLYFGKPMIVLPQFMDQHDNAQRVAEMKLGAKLNAYTVSESELLETIDSLVNDNDLKQRLSDISEQMKKSTALLQVAERVEKIAENPKIPYILHK